MATTENVVAIAGATGNAGREIVRAVHSHGLQIRALVRAPERLLDVRPLCQDIRIVQVTRAQTLEGSLDGAYALISAVGKTWQKDRISRREVDVEANRNLFAEAKRAGVRRIIFISVAGASDEHPVTMMRMKAEAEDALERTGIDYAVIQPSGYFSDLWEVFEMCRKGTLYSVGDGNLPFNPIATEDLGEFTADTLLAEGKSRVKLPVGGPQEITILDVAHMAERITSRHVRVVRIPLWLAKLGLLILKPFDRNLWEMSEMFVGNVAHAMSTGNTMLQPPYGFRRLEDYFRRRFLAGD